MNDIWICIAGIAMGIFLGYLDFALLWAVTRKALQLDPRRAIRLARWGGFGRLILVFLGLLSGAVILGPKAFLAMALAFSVCRAVGLVRATRRIQASARVSNRVPADSGGPSG